MNAGYREEWAGVLEHVHGEKPVQPKKGKRTRARNTAPHRSELQRALEPKATPPPALTAPRCQNGPLCRHTATVYACGCEDTVADPRERPTTCIGSAVPARVRKDGSHDLFRCQACDLCHWEKEAERYRSSVDDAGAERMRRAIRIERACPFSSLDAAIVAFAEWERHDRWGPSAMGPLINKLETGQVGGGGSGKARRDPLLDRAADVVMVRSAITRAYAEDNEWRLSPLTCRVLLVARTGGALQKQPGWDVLAELFAVPRARIKSLVTAGRRAVSIELAARGVIPMPPPQAGLHDEIDTLRGALTIEAQHE